MKPKDSVWTGREQKKGRGQSSPVPAVSCRRPVLFQLLQVLTQRSILCNLYNVVGAVLPLPFRIILTAASSNSKHVLNAQVSIRAPCCRKWFDCAECHREQETHPLKKTTEMTFACKKCKKCFRKDATEFDETDEYCPHCDNHFVIEAVTPKPALRVEGEDARMDARMLKDDRVRKDTERSIFNIKDAYERLG
ncbi:hypothetical protein MPDQ_007514 [Monascus purpureus]|uniref:CHY-type domain-containing protein n=1 Tax=Monascus purpureus TaxID=5098 RepID=A0A507R2I8_MONPU|nr:hypothetical protein MPDQ_007514 [Monascus purpureus]